MRQAAEELYALLDQQGLDPEKSSPKEIRQAVERYQSEREEGRSLDQTFSDGPRGRITFAEGRNVIDLFEKRDLSTFLHESGHLYLEELRADAAGPDAPAQVKEDWQAIVDWFAASGQKLEGGNIPTEAHELFARGFERFAMEGKTPSSALRKAFDAFRSWLLTIYKVVDNLRSPISPEVRGVMERLIATDEEVAQATEEQNIKALFSSAQEAGMTEAEFAAYRSAAAESRNEAHDALLYRTMAALRRERTKAWKDEEASVRADVTSRVDARPEFRAVRLLTTGKLAEDAEPQKIKLDRAWLVETYGQDAIGMLPRRVPPIYSENGSNADMIAEMAGFPNGDELVRTLMGLESRQRELREGGDKRTVRQVLIDEETADTMRDRHGDILHDGTIEDEARALIHNDRQGEVIASELRSLARRTGRRPTPYAIARQWAAERIAASTVAEATSGSALQRYERAARKAGQAAEAAMLAGDVDETYRQKQAQMLNNALISEAKKAKDQVDLAVRRLGKLARRKTIKSIDQGHLDQVHGLLDQVEFRPRSQSSLDRQESFEDWAAAQEALGFDVVVPGSFASSLGTTHWSRLPVERLLGLDETVKQIVHLGRLKQKLLDGKDEREFNAVVDEGVGQLGGLPPIPVDNNLKPTPWGKAKSWIRSADVALLKMEQLIDWMDGSNPEGVFNRVVWQRLSNAQAVETDLTSEYARRINEVTESVPLEQRRRWTDKVSVPELINAETGLPYNNITRDTLIRIALNMGNEGNLQRLQDGYRWPRAALDAAVSRLTAEEWQYVQGVWDTVDTLWPQIEALEKRLNGIAPDKIEASALETPYGTIRGGYFPAVYDPTKSRAAEQHSQQDSMALFENNYRRATTRASSTKERAEKVERKLLLDASVVNNHLREVIHDIAWREAIIDTDRFLSNSRIQGAVERAFGREYAGAFRPWLQSIANEQARDAVTPGVVSGIFRGLRQRVTIVGLGYRFTTIAAQFAGYSNVIAEVGVRDWAAGNALWLRNPKAGYDEVVARSGEMRARFSNMDRDVRENARRYEESKGAAKVPAAVARFAFHGILYADMVITVPAWIGAFNKGQRQGMDEEQSAFYADKVVRQSQGAGAAKDLSGIMRSSEGTRFITIFYSYFNALYARQRNLGRDWARAGVRDVPSLLARSWWLLIVPNLISLWIRDDEPEEDEDAGLWLARKLLVGNMSSIPGIRDVVSAMDSGYGYKLSPIQNVGEGVIKTTKNIKAVFDEDDEPSDKWLKQGLETLGLLTKQPLGAPGGTAQFLLDWYEGDVDPETASELWEGLTKGKIEED